MCPRSIAEQGSGAGGCGRPAAARAGRRSARPAGRTSAWGVAERHADGLVRVASVDLELHLVAGLLLRDRVAELLERRHLLAVDADDDVTADRVRVAADDDLRPAGAYASLVGAAAGL